MLYNIKYYMVSLMIKKGLSLAEILITVGIIGIVAVITIPTLINEHKKIVTVNKLKKNYTLFAQVVQMSERDNETVENWDYSLSNNEFAEKYFLPYLPNAKKSNNKYSIYALGGKQTSLFANILSGGYAGAYMYSLPDGTLFGTCNAYSEYNPLFLSVIVVDLNGIKGPNIAGKDVFHFALNRFTKKFEMLGLGQDRNTMLSLPEQEEQIWELNCAISNNTYAGVYCGYVIMLDGWKISPDYPW